MLKFFILIFLISSVQARRISEEKCEEYKNMLKTTQCFGFSVFDDCPGKRSFYECNFGNTGLRKKRSIIGPVEAKSGEFSHMAAIGWELEDGDVAFKCGGSLISDRFVLTAAHCEWDDSSESQPSLVRLGVQNLVTNGPELVERKIKKFIKHPGYSSIHNTVDDIALIELSEPVKFHKQFLRPACLQQDELAGNNVTLTGWFSKSTFGQASDSLLKVLLPVVGIKKCKDSFKTDGLDEKKQICAGGERRKGACNGASGAPIQLAHSDALCVYNIAGITSSYPFIYGRQKPSIFTKTSHYLDWIESIVWPKK